MIVNGVSDQETTKITKMKALVRMHFMPHLALEISRLRRAAPAINAPLITPNMHPNAIALRRPKVSLV